MKLRFSETNRGFFLLEGLYWSAYCVLFAFTVTIFSAYGYSTAICGVVATLQYIVLLVGQPLYGYIIDHLLSPKRFFILLTAADIVFSFALPYVFSQGLWVLLPYYVVFSFFNFSAYSVVDTWAIEVDNHLPGLDFGLQRGGGSILYAAVALLGGNLIAPFGIEVLFVLHIALSFLLLLLSCFLVDSAKLRQTHLDSAEAPVPEEAPGLREVLRLLLKNRAFVLYTICMGLYYFGTRATSMYLPVILGAAGGGSGHYGLALFISACGELFVMLWASRLLSNGVPIEHLFSLCLAMMVLRFLLLALVPRLWVILLGQVLLAAGSGLQLRSGTQYLAAITPENCHGMAILLSGSVSSGIGGMLGNLLGGILVESWGVRGYVLLCTATFMLGFALFLPLSREALHRARMQARQHFYQHNPHQDV